MVSNKYLIVLQGIFVLLSACCSSKVKTLNYGNCDPGLETVTVVDQSDLDGCKYLLHGAGDNWYQPVNLPDSLAVNGKKICISYKVVDGMSICMKGKMINLHTIKLPAP